MKRAGGFPASRLSLVYTGVLLIALSALTVWLAPHLIGRVVFAQEVSADEISRGFDFGPIYFASGRHYVFTIFAKIPKSERFWETSTEVLDSNKRRVTGQDEFVLNATQTFRPGGKAEWTYSFQPSESSGYFYVRFEQRNGNYRDVDPAGLPVARLSVAEDPPSPVIIWLAGILCGAVGLVCGWLGLRPAPPPPDPLLSDL